MIERERAESEHRRKQIFAQNRVMNRPRPNRVIPVGDIHEEMMARMGFRLDLEDATVNWAALTRDQ